MGGGACTGDGSHSLCPVYGKIGVRVGWQTTHGQFGSDISRLFEVLH